MNTRHFLAMSGAVLLLATALPFSALRAGEDGLSPMAQMDDYLHGQRVAHAIEAVGGDFKGDGTETLTVRIYGVSDETRQNALCTVLAATAKKNRVHGAKALFFASGPSGAVQPVVFQPSQLPSGNGSVVFARDPSPSAGYRLLRTVKL